MEKAIRPNEISTDFTATEVKRILKISDDGTFYRLCEQGKVPGVYRLGGQWRFHRGAFEARLSLEEWRVRQKAAS